MAYLSGFQTHDIRTVTADVTLTKFDHSILVDPAAATTVSLPAAAAAPEHIFYVKAIDVDSAVVIDPNGAETIDGAATYTFAGDNDAVIIQSDGTKWVILSSITGADVTIYSGDGTLASARTVTQNALSLTFDGVSGTDATSVVFDPAAGITLTDTSSNGASSVAIANDDITFTSVERIAMSGTEQKGLDTKTAAYTVVPGDNVLVGDGSGAAVPFTLPAAPEAGDTYTFIASDTTNAVSINGNGKLIEGNATVSLDDQYDSVELIYDGTSWYIANRTDADEATNIYVADDSLTANRTATGAGFNLDWVMTTGTKTNSFTTGSHVVTATSGTDVTSVTTSATGGLVTSSTDGTDTTTITSIPASTTINTTDGTVVGQVLTSNGATTMSQTDGTNTSTVNLSATDATITADERVALVGTLQYNLTSSAANVTVAPGTHNVILLDGAAAARTATLPAAHEAGDLYTIKSIDNTNANIVATADADTIDGNAQYTFGVTNESITVVSDGTNWYII